MRILAIETSCDETSIAALQTEADGSFKLLSNIVSSQVKIHAPFGGVVPMLAKREHQKNLVPILKQALKKSGLLLPDRAPQQRGESNANKENPSTPADYGLRSGNKLRNILAREPELLKKLLPFLKRYAKPNIDAIAVTIGPGLEPALWAGANFARALGYFWNLPIIPVNHIEGHIAANWLDVANRRLLTADRSGGKQSAVDGKQFPILCLVVSGGHTQLVLMKKFGHYKIIGETRDDAAGEAFDKLAKMLNLGYPGGPIVSKIASRYSPVASRSVAFPRPMINSPDYDFSFSGLKTAALYFVKTLDKKTLKKLTPEICTEFQQAVVDVLVSKTIRAAKEFDARTVMLSGGVAANDLLSKTLKLKTFNLKLNFSVPQKNYCTDNAAMIALTAALRFKNYDLRFKNKYSWQKIKVDSNLRLA